MRVLERLDELAAIGDRIGYSPEEDAAHELAAGWFREAGLEVEVDAAGNLVGRVPGGDRQIWTGSHLDTVPGGGRFDGALGVVAGLEAVERLGLPGLAVVAFRDEERGCAGSRACAARPDAFVELHIEQGPTLLRADAPLGVVTGIVGYVRGRKTFEGTAGHAGTTPMAGRHDALVAAAEYVLRAREVARRDRGRGGHDRPGHGRARRHQCDSRARRRLGRRAGARRGGGSTGLRPRSRSRSRCGRSLSPMSDDVRGRAAHGGRVRRSAGARAPLGRGPRRGHPRERRACPSGMLFVRSLNGGVSHNPAELSSAEDIALATDALERALRHLVKVG